jgi:hypothetical protein
MRASILRLCNQGCHSFRRLEAMAEIDALPLTRNVVNYRGMKRIWTRLMPFPACPKRCALARGRSVQPLDLDDRRAVIAVGTIAGAIRRDRFLSDTGNPISAASKPNGLSRHPSSCGETPGTSSTATPVTGRPGSRKGQVTFRIE